MNGIEENSDGDRVDFGSVIEETRGGAVLLNDTNGQQQQRIGLTDD